MRAAKQQYPLQSILNTNDTAYKKFINDVKSPFQILQLDRTSATEDFSHYKTAVDGDFSRNRVSSVLVYNNGQEVQPPDEGESRIRKRIFQEKTKNQSGFWPSLFSAINGLIFGDSSPPSPILPQNEGYSLSQTKLSRMIPKIPEFKPLTVTEQSSIFYENTQILQHQQQFIEFILKILPKLFLKSTISAHICAQKSQILQALLSRLENEQKYKVLGSIFGVDNVQRIDKRMKTENVGDFLGELTEISRGSIREQQRKRILHDTQRMMQILGEVEDDIRVYLSTFNRVQELEDIFDIFCELEPRPKKLIVLFEGYLSSRGITCSQKELLPLSYIWKGLDHKQYSKRIFIEELTCNDYVLRQRQAESECDLFSELQKMGYERNKN